MIEKPSNSNISSGNETVKSQEIEMDFISEVEIKISRSLPIEKLLDIFGSDTYLIGGAVRDFLFGKKPSDFDIMSRIPPQQAILNLEKLGFIKRDLKPIKDGEFIFKIDETSNNLTLNTGVLTLFLDGKEFQVGFVGQRNFKDLIEQGDINLSCGAFSISEKVLVDKELAKNIKEKVLRFNNPDVAKKDPEKVLSALKAISRFPDLTIPNETLETIETCIPEFIRFFTEDSTKRQKLNVIFGNINSVEVLNLFRNFDTSVLFSGFENKKHKLDVDSPYVSCSIKNLDPEVKEKISGFLKERFGKRFKPEKVFNDKVNSVVYELSETGDVLCCCLIDGERLYATASQSPQNLVNLVKSLRKNNYNVWTTISINSKLLIKMSEDAGLSQVKDEVILNKILVNHYPQYIGKIVVEKYGSFIVFRKLDDNDLQVLMWS